MQDWSPEKHSLWGPNSPHGPHEDTQLAQRTPPHPMGIDADLGHDKVWNPFRLDLESSR